MGLLPTRDQLIGALWRLPIWAPLTGAIRLAGGPFVRPMRPGTLPDVPDPAPLDAFQQKHTHGLTAGAARKSITPTNPVGVFLAGFDNQRRCSELRDPLFARAMVLSDGKTPLVVVTLDLIGLSLARTERIRARLTRRFPDSVLVLCTHNHQSPDTLGLWGKDLGGFLPIHTGLDPAYQDFVEDQAIACVQEACQTARPARLKLGSVPFDTAGKLVHNERSPIVDRDLRALHLYDLKGRSLATLMQYACHPETLWRENHRMSADFPAVACQRIEQELGGVGLYANGALGAMVTVATPWETPSERREGLLTDIGEAIAQAVARLVRATPKAERDFSLTVRRAPLLFPLGENRLYGLLLALGVVEDRSLAHGLESEMTFVRLGRASFTGVPGEAAPELGLKLLERVPGQPRFFFGLCNDELGYLLPKLFFRDEKYAYERFMTPGPSTEEILLRTLGELVQARRVG